MLFHYWQQSPSTKWRENRTEINGSMELKFIFPSLANDGKSVNAGAIFSKALHAIF